MHRHLEPRRAANSWTYLDKRPSSTSPRITQTRCALAPSPRSSPTSASPPSPFTTPRHGSVSQWPALPGPQPRPQGSPLPRAHPRCAPFTPFPSSSDPADGVGVRRLDPLLAGRLDQFEGGNFPNITNVLFKHRLDDKEHVSLEYWSSPGRDKARLLTASSLVVCVMGLTLAAPRRPRSRKPSASRSSPPRRDSALDPPGPSTSSSALARCLALACFRPTEVISSRLS